MRTACIVILAALTLASCGSSSTTVLSTAANAPSPSTGTASTPTATATTSASTTTTAAGPAPCRAVTLALSFLGQQGATGHGELGLALRNVGSSSCRTFGYPGVLFLDQSGAPLPTVPTHATHDFFGAAPEVSLVLGPGMSASFRLGVTHGINSTAGCATAYGLQVIPPDDTGTLRATIPMGAFECRTVTVSPLRPDVSAYP
jgi:hypothetical protein